MTHVVTDNCINCKYTECVEICPVDCFHEGPNFLVIDPDECIDCEACVPVCPSNAIFDEREIPSGKNNLIEINAELAREWPVILKSKEELPNADEWNGKKDKLHLLQR